MQIVWMSLTVHPNLSGVARERYSDGAPSIQGTSPTMLVVDGGRRLAFRGPAL